MLSKSASTPCVLTTSPNMTSDTVRAMTSASSACFAALRITVALPSQKLRHRVSAQPLRGERTVAVQWVAVIVQADHLVVEEGQHAAAGKPTDGGRVIDDLVRAWRRRLHHFAEAHTLALV